VLAYEVRTRASEETEALGEALGRVARGGELIGLVGELGAGKTCLVRGLARGLGIAPECVHSPSFVIATDYPGGRLPLAHVDLYRLAAAGEEVAFLRDVLYGEGVAAVEWFDRLDASAIDEALLLTFDFAPGEGRVIRLTARDARYEHLIDAARGR
jgi:tRNA threonylcarbamoyladenosine biosynthesis protein TsaE